jgi:hypothetical protein
VRGAAQAAQRAGEAVDHPSPAFASASPPHRLTQAISSRLAGHSCSIRILSANSPRDRLLAESIGEGSGPAAEPGLDHLGQGVEAGAQGDAPRRVVGERRVDNRQVRQHSVVAQAHFPLLFRDVDHRIFVTSAPVPAVVGIATNGSGLASN